MPLPACKPMTQVQYYFITAGPYDPSCEHSWMRDQIDSVLNKAYGQQLLKAASSFEVGRDNPDDPYYHIHVAISLSRPCRWKACNRELRGCIEKFPRRAEERRKVSTRWFYTGKVEDPWKVMTDYLTCPSKEKEVGDFLEHADIDYASKSMVDPPDMSLTYGYFADFCKVKEKDKAEWCKRLYHRDRTPKGQK